VEAAYRKLAALNHPDKGGDEELMKQLTRARHLLLQPR
jgi:curved DNA-binding protein CbpA